MVESTESITQSAIVLIKPSGLETHVGGIDVSTLMIGLLESAGLTIEQRIEVQLNETDIRHIYPILNVPDPIYGEQWKVEVIEHLMSRPVVALLVTGDQAQLKARLIKNYIRDVFNHSGDYQNKVVKNMAHVADPEDFQTTYNILFSRELCVK